MATVLGRGVYGIVVEHGPDAVLKCNTRSLTHRAHLDGLSELVILQTLCGHPAICTLLSVPTHREGTLPEMLTLGEKGDTAALGDLLAPCHSQQILPNRFGYLFERAPLGDLEGLVAKGELLKRPYATRLLWIKQVAEAVAHCHHHGVLHRDLSIKNVLVFSDQQVKLTDFGLSRHFTPGDLAVTRALGFLPHLTPTDGDRLTSDVLGAPCYASPEVLLGSSVVTFKSDVWSFGMLAFEILTGGQHLLETDWALAEEPVEGSPDPLWLAILRSIVRVHTERPGTMLLDRLYTPSLRHPLPKHGLDQEKTRGKTWAGWVVSTYRGEDKDTALAQVNRRALDDFFTGCFKWSPSARFGMNGVLFSPFFSPLPTPLREPSAVVVGPWTPPSESVVDHPLYHRTLSFLRIIARGLKTRWGVQTWLWVAVSVLERVLPAFALEGVEARGLAAGLFRFAMLWKEPHESDLPDLGRALGTPSLSLRVQEQRVVDFLFFDVLDKGEGLVVFPKTLWDHIEIQACAHPLLIRAFLRKAKGLSEMLFSRLPWSSAEAAWCEADAFLKRD